MGGGKGIRLIRPGFRHALEAIAAQPNFRGNKSSVKRKQTPDGKLTNRYSAT